MSCHVTHVSITQYGYVELIANATQVLRRKGEPHA